MSTYYTPSHEWARAHGSLTRIGISSHAAHEIGEVVHVHLPPAGERVKAGELCCEIESVKSINEINAPVSGLITAINTAILENPNALNADAEGNGWLLEIECDNELPSGDLVDASAYQKIITPA